MRNGTSPQQHSEQKSTLEKAPPFDYEHCRDFYLTKRKLPLNENVKILLQKPTNRKTTSQNNTKDLQPAIENNVIKQTDNQSQIIITSHKKRKYP